MTTRTDIDIMQEENIIDIFKVNFLEIMLRDMEAEAKADPSKFNKRVLTELKIMTDLAFLCMLDGALQFIQFFAITDIEEAEKKIESIVNFAESDLKNEHFEYGTIVNIDDSRLLFQSRSALIRSINFGAYCAGCWVFVGPQKDGQLEKRIAGLENQRRILQEALIDALVVAKAKEGMKDVTLH